MFTDIHTLKDKVKGHPWVTSVVEHEETKVIDKSAFDAIGRCTHGHQSPFDLMITTICLPDMLVGWSVNHCAAGQGQVWWSWTKPEVQTSHHRELVFMFFLISAA